MDKNKLIGQSLKQTREKRKSQRPITIELQLILNKKWQKEYIHGLLTESRILYNWTIVDIENRLDVNIANQLDILPVKIGKDEYIQRELTYLSSQMKQNVQVQIKQNLLSLKKRKEKGYKTGKLKFKNKFNFKCITFSNQTYKVKGNRIRFQGMDRKRSIYCRGIKQLDTLKNQYSEIEFGSINLIRKGHKHYVQLVVYVPKEEYEYYKSQKQIGNVIGFDFGIKHQFVTSNGIKFQFKIPENNKLKKISRKIQKSVKGSKNNHKLRFKLQQEYTNIWNIKRNIHNRIRGFFNLYNTIAFQDELIDRWKKLFGRQIQQSSIGKLLESLKWHSNPIELPSSVPTTKTCSICQFKNNHINLRDRTFICPNCNSQIDRDINSARNMLVLSNIDVPMEHGVTPVEFSAIQRYFGNCPNLNVTMVLSNEAGSPRL